MYKFRILLRNEIWTLFSIHASISWNNYWLECHCSRLPGTERFFVLIVHKLIYYGALSFELWTSSIRWKYQEGTHVPPPVRIKCFQTSVKIRVRFPRYLLSKTITVWCSIFLTVYLLKTKKYKILNTFEKVHTIVYFYLSNCRCRYH